MKWNGTCEYFLAFITLSSLFIPAAQAQQLSSYDRSRVVDMLRDVGADVERHYYDPNFHGVDWKATVLKAKQNIEGANSLNMALAYVAQALVTLDDSHTFFLPPPRPYVHDYGFQMQMIGDRCFVTRVRPGGDAETKEVKPGDELLSLNGYQPDRLDLWKIEYRFNVLRPELQLRLALRDVQGQQHQVDIRATFKQLQLVRDVTGSGIWDLIREREDREHDTRQRWTKAGDDVGILKFPSFRFSQSEVKSMINKARKCSGLIVDLRGNPGGAVDTLKYLLSDLFDREVTIGERVGRKKSKPEVAKSGGHGSFSGKLVVLVDSKSASAAELFARIVQLEKRGVVIGDRTSGHVMEAKVYDHKIGEETAVFFGAEITEADILMSDGRSLEHTGVTPDELVLPTASDLAEGRDPVLSRAAALLGAKLTPEDAGKMFPYEWPKLQ